MQHFRSNPPSRQIRPVPLYAPPAARKGAESDIAPGELAGALIRFTKRSGIDQAAIGRKFGDEHLIADLRRGILPNRHRVTRIRAFIEREARCA